MLSSVVDQVCSPPELPPYLRNVCDLKDISGAPTDDELIGIHAVIQVAHKVVDVQGVGDSILLFRLSEHLFNAQMTRYRSKYQGAILPEHATYTPPTLPSHVAVKLEPVTGIPSEDDVIKVQGAMRMYQQLSNTSPLFEPRVNMELSQHLFDIQAARYMQRITQDQSGSLSHETGSSRVVKQVDDVIKGPTTSVNETGVNAHVTASAISRQALQDVDIRDAMEKSNRLAEQANLLIERSNELMERSQWSVDQSNEHAEQFNQLFERLTNHFEQSGHLARDIIKPVKNVGDTLGNINKVLVRIQHAIIRGHKGNTVSALDCLTNEKGETPAIAVMTGFHTFADFSTEGHSYPIPVKIDGALQTPQIPGEWLVDFLRFYGIGKELIDSSDNQLKAGKYKAALTRLSEYLSSCLG